MSIDNYISKTVKVVANKNREYAEQSKDLNSKGDIKKTLNILLNKINRIDLNISMLLNKIIL